MCGIGGIMVYNKANRSQEEWQFIKELTTELALENQARGSHATGFAVFGKRSSDVFKYDYSADRLTETQAYKNFLDKNINENTYNILIHTRFATQGSPKNNANNHPIVTSNVIGVHNGWINNDDSLFEKEGIERIAQVDSEIIFQLANNEIGNERENTKTVAEKLAGVYAVAFVKKSEPHILNWFRNNNPTTFAYIPDLNITVFASVQNYIKSALATVNASLYYETGFSISETNVQYFSPKEDTIMQFDITENTPVQQLEQAPLKFTENYDYSYYGYSNYSQGWMDDDWYDYRSDRTKELAEEESKKSANIYEFIEEHNLEYFMTAEEYTEMIELLDQNEKNEWSRGYKSGRESLESEIKLLKEEIVSLQAVNKLAN